VHGSMMFTHGEGQLQPAIGQLGFNAAFYVWNISRDEMDLRQDGLACEHLGRHSPAFAHRPSVILIVAVEDGDERPRVGEDAFHRP